MSGQMREIQCLDACLRRHHVEELLCVGNGHCPKLPFIGHERKVHAAENKKAGCCDHDQGLPAASVGGHDDHHCF